MVINPVKRKWKSMLNFEYFVIFVYLSESLTSRGSSSLNRPNGDEPERDENGRLIFKIGNGLFFVIIEENIRIENKEKTKKAGY